MPISPEEQRDIDELHAKQASKRENAFFAARDADRVPADKWADFAYVRGYDGKTKEQYIADVVRRVLRDNDRLMAEFLKKWPD